MPASARRRLLRQAKFNDASISDPVTLTLAAMSIALPAVADHPNRMPFTGVLTFVDRPSDQAVGGAGGKKTYLPRAVAEKALPSLLGMAVDFEPDLGGHDPKRKIGLITAANIEDDGSVTIAGFFYAADFPQECQRIQDEKEDLGFSYEIRAQTQPMGDLLQIVDGDFTGAAVLYKDKAAYQSTSLAANAEEFDMTPEELKKLLAEAVAPITQKVDALTADVTKLKATSESTAADLKASKEMREKVAPHATALRNCAASMEAAGIGLHSEKGHVRVLHHMAGQMEADAAAGKLPHIYRDHDWSLGASRADPVEPAKIDLKVIGDAVTAAIKPLQDELAAAQTKITDLSAKTFNASAAPERKTLSGEGTALLAKSGIKPDEKTGKINVRQLDAAADKAGMSNAQSIALKIALTDAGMLEAA